MEQQQRYVQNLERQFQQSSGKIGASMKGLSGTLATYFTGRELTGLLDSFTRLQNNLRVAGLEGDNLKAAQDRLFESAQRYGVELEGLSSLFSTLTQASKELGATQSQVFGITDAVSASLKITGMSAQEASGALLQLGQALRGGKIQAEEYNSLLDGLYPLLEAAANGSDRWKGSVAALTKQVKDGKVSSKEFFDAILAGSDMLEGKAAQATLTLGAGMTALSNAFTIYFGEADKANGVSAALGETLGALADNLDTIIPAIAAIAAGYGAYIIAANTATVATAGFGTALSVVSKHPVAIAMAAVAAGLVYLATRTKESTAATGEYAKSLGDLKKAQDGATGAIEKLNTATGKAREEARKAAIAKRDQAKADLQAAQSALIHASAQAVLAKERLKAEMTYAARNTRETPGSGLVRAAASNADQASANEKAAEQKVIGLMKLIGQLDEALNAPPPSLSPTSTDGGKKSKPTGPTAAEIERRFQSELASETQRTLAARRDLATSAEEQAEMERRALELALLQYKEDVKGDKDYSKSQKAELLRQAEKTAEYERERIDRDERERLNQEALDVQQASIDNQRDLLKADADLADTREERRALEMKLLDLAYEQERAELQAVKDSLTASEAQKQIAQARLAILDQLKARDTESINRQYESPLARRRREVQATAKDMTDSMEDIQLDAIDRLTDGIADASTEFIKLGGIAGDVINGIIRDMVRLAAQQAIFGKAGGGGILGSIGGLLGIGGSTYRGTAPIYAGSDPGPIAVKVDGFRAAGGPVAVGKSYIVGENGPELFTPASSGSIVPNHQLAAAHAMTRVDAAPVRNVTQVTQVLKLDLRDAVMTPELLNQMNQKAQAAAVGGAMAGSQDAQRTIARRGRNTLR